jgi:polyferredoxin
MAKFLQRNHVLIFFKKKTTKITWKKKRKKNLKYIAWFNISWKILKTILKNSLFAYIMDLIISLLSILGTWSKFKKKYQKQICLRLIFLDLQTYI